MNLDILNDLVEEIKKNEGVRNFIKELGESLENKLTNNENNNMSLVQNKLKENTLTSKYRDEINIQKSNIISNYSKNKEMYYIYNKSSDDMYGIVEYINGKSSEDIWVEAEKIPKEAKVDTVLKKEDNQFIVDKIATKELQEKIIEMINNLIEQQEKELEEKRIEGHLYEFVEKTGDTIWLIDKNNINGNCFEEIKFRKDTFENAKEGNIYQYVNGEYIFIDK